MSSRASSEKHFVDHAAPDFAAWTSGPRKRRRVRFLPHRELYELGAITQARAPSSRRRHARVVRRVGGRQPACALFAQEFFWCARRQLRRRAAAARAARAAAAARRLARVAADARPNKGAARRRLQPTGAARGVRRRQGVPAAEHEPRDHHDDLVVRRHPRLRPRRRVPDEGARRHDGLFHGVPRREVAERRQPLRLPDALRVLQGARGVPAARAQVGDHLRPRPPRLHDRARHRRHPALPPDAPPLCGHSRRLRLEDAPGARPAAPPRRPAAAAPSSLAHPPSPSRSRRTTWTWPTTR